MKTLIVPDIHEKFNTLQSLEPNLEEADRVVFLGDWFDSFHHDIVNVKLLTTWMLCHIFDKKYTFLWGNHDQHYAFKKTGFSSGYQEDTQDLLDDEFNQEVWRKFTIFTEVGPYLVSHAGLNKETQHFRDAEDKALECAFTNQPHQLWCAGQASGGPAQFGGPTWLRWWELDNIGQPQIVGHTPGNEVRHEDTNYCLDTNLGHIAWYNDDTKKLEIEEIK